MKAFGWYWLIGCIGLLFSIETIAQPFNGDYRSVATGNWSSISTWEVYNGSAWVAATDYPANTAAPFGPAYYVTLQSPFIITLDISLRSGQISNLIVDFGATLVDTPTALFYNLRTQNPITINGTVNLTNTTNLTSQIASGTFIDISSTGVLLAHNVDVNDFINNYGTATVTRDIKNTSTTSIWRNFSNSTLNFGGSAMTATLQANSPNNTVNYYSSSTNQTIKSTTYFNLTISGNGRAKSLAAATSVSGSVSVQGSSNFNLAGFNLSVGRDWNYASSGMLLGTTNAIVTFNGSVTQNIINTGESSGTIFENVTFNNTSTTSPQINLQTTMWVDRTLTMIQGNVNLNGNSLRHGPVAGSLTTLVHNGLSSAGWFYGGFYIRSFQDGATIADGSVSGLFPVGTSQNFRPVYISSPTVAITNQAITVLVSSASNVTDVSIPDAGGPIVRQHQGAWQINSQVGATGLFNITAGGTGFLYIGSINDLQLTLASSVVGNAGTNSGTTILPYVQRTGLSPAQLSNTFYLGSVNKINSPLPVELISFTGEAEGTTVNLKWVTRTELNCDYFTVYRSHNGIDFVPVATRKGAGTTKEQRTYEVNDENPWKGINYYRLEQTDLNGSKNSLDLISVEAQGTDAIQFYPTQLSRGQNLHLKLEGLAADTQLELNLINAVGQRMDQYFIQTDANGRFYGEVQIRDISAGFYYLKLNRIAKKLIIY